MTVSIQMTSDGEREEEKAFLRSEYANGQPTPPSRRTFFSAKKAHFLTFATMTFLLLCLWKSTGISTQGHASAPYQSNTPKAPSPEVTSKGTSYIPSPMKWWQQKNAYDAAISAAKAASAKLKATQQVYDDEMPVRYNGTFPHVKLNSTLGFEKIYAVHLPSRIDKEDELALMGFATDIDVTLFNGVSTDNLKDAHLSDIDWKFLGPGNIGSWRSHLNVIRHVVTNRIETALIIEDDADWSMDIKEQMQRLQSPLANLIGSMKRDGQARGPSETHPWGSADDWDILMFGACMEMSWADDKSDKEGRTLVDDKLIDPAHLPYLTYEDPTMLEEDKITENPRNLLKSYNVPMASSKSSPSFQRRRVVQKANSPVCSLAYAVTRRGAARILYKLTRPHDYAFDNELAWLMEDTYAHGYTIYPPLMKQWRREGGDNSDIHPQDVSEHPKLGAFDAGDTEDIFRSTRQRLRQSILHHATRKGKKLVETI